MATVPEDQRYALDEDGNPVEDRITLYQQAWKRIQKIKEKVSLEVIFRQSHFL